MGFFDWLFGRNSSNEKEEQIFRNYLQATANWNVQRQKEKQEKFESFYPSNFREYKGQSKAKAIVRNFLKATQQRKTVFPHTLIHSETGMGKTSLARLIAKNLDVYYVETVASNLRENLSDHVRNVGGGVLFVDEIHSIGRDEVEKIYQAMEDFKLEGEKIEPFTLIGATTEVGELLRDRRPFYNRFKLVLELEQYTVQNIIKILEDYNLQKFPNDKIGTDKVTSIAQNSKLNPRTAKNLLESLIYFGGDLCKVFSSFKIVEAGLTEKDVKVLGYLKKHKAIGAQGIASFLGTSEQNYLYDIEPFLLRSELIVRAPKGRVITDEGLKMLALIDEKKTPSTKGVGRTEGI